ncbi:MAG: M23 family metallopeptidase [Paludibacteraceae bacterium]|nr:M23 family metallopeptidase [Paludibacteraceae bacterium]
MASSLWQRLRFKFRISVVNENTLGEIWHFRLSRMGVFLWVVFLALLSFALFALLIWLTPLKNYLPGYNENIRQQLITETMRMDSIESKLSLQTEYLDIIRDVVAGEVESDSVQPLDSLALQQRQKLLETRSAITDEFIAQYEEKERDNLTMFDVQSSTPVYTLFRPVNGRVEQQFSAIEGNYGVGISVEKNAAVMSVLTGTVVYAARSLDFEWEMMVQHEGDYLSVYKNLKQIKKQVGESVQAGENIATVADDRLLLFSLWRKGNPVNPEEVIVF